MLEEPNNYKKGDLEDLPLSVKQMGMIINPPVFWISSILIVVFILLTLINVEAAGKTFSAIKSWMSVYFGWFFIGVVDILLIYGIYLLFSKFSKIRIGGKDAEPEFTLWGWFSMLFSAGMGIGLLFWGVGEPMYHLGSPPMGVAAGTAEGAKMAMGVTFFHWGLHAWAIYAILGLALAFFSFNRGLPLTIRSVFYPVLGEKINGGIGHTIDILAVLATLFGLATSLGLGVKQINAGLTHVFGIPNTVTVQVCLIIVITGFAICSVVAGLDAGIKRLSQLNIILGLALMCFVFFAGPTLFLIESFIENIGIYIQKLIPLSFWTESYVADTWAGKATWQHWWTIFYWAWWIAWAPFVGMFIARISKGRTIGQFMTGVLFVPCALTFLWLTIFGGSAIFVELAGNGGIIAAVKKDVSTAIYVLFDNFPLSSVISILTVIVVTTFFVTSSDSASLVIDIITAGGHTEPPIMQRIFWASTEGVCAAVLLLGGGLGALQTGSIVTGLPFGIILILMLFSLKKGLDQEYNKYYS